MGNFNIGQDLDNLKTKQISQAVVQCLTSGMDECITIWIIYVMLCYAPIIYEEKYYYIGKWATF